MAKKKEVLAETQENTTESAASEHEVLAAEAEVTTDSGTEEAVLPTDDRKAPEGMTFHKVPGGPEVVRPKPMAPEEVDSHIVGSVCIECGRWDPAIGIPWCRACGGRVAAGSKSQAKSLVEADMKRRGMK